MSFLLFKALVRDGFRCVISGRYDINSAERSKELLLEYKSAGNAGSCISECAHILPESTNARISGSNAQDDKVFFFLST